MTSLSLAECCRLLAIDPKTLRQWVVQAQMGLHTDPTNIPRQELLDIYLSYLLHETPCLSNENRIRYSQRR